MTRLGSKDRALRTSKKLTLQNRMLGKKRRDTLTEALQKELSFLELEASVAIWAEIERRPISQPTTYNGYTHIEVADNCELYIRKMEAVLADLKESSGYCFTSDWKSTGVVVLDSSDLSKDLNSIMFRLDDEISFFNADLTKAIFLLGDRSGSGGRLNELSVSVLSSDWVRTCEGID